MADREEIITRIQALRARASDSASSEAEAEAADMIKDAAKAGLRPTSGTYRALKSARVMITADECDAFLRSLLPMPLAGEEVQ